MDLFSHDRAFLIKAISKQTINEFTGGLPVRMAWCYDVYAL